MERLADASLQSERDGITKRAILGRSVMKFNVVISTVGGKEYRTSIEASTIAEAEGILLKSSSWYEFPVGAALVKVNPASVISVEFHPLDTDYSHRIEAFMPLTMDTEDSYAEVATNGARS